MFKSALLLTLAGLSTFIDAAPQARIKRGLAVAKTDYKLMRYFTGSPKITWFHVWEGRVDGNPLQIEFVPMLHSNLPWCTEHWFEDVKEAQRKRKVTHLLGFNEPDHQGPGSNPMDAAVAAQAFKQFMLPLAEQGLRLGSPAVTNSNLQGEGIGWLQNFMAHCKNCRIDFVVTHYYDSYHSPADFDRFKNYITNFHNILQKNVWITEFGVTEGNADEFLKLALPWLDSQSWIERYSFFKTALSTGKDMYLINAAGTGLSSTGKIYAST